MRGEKTKFKLESVDVDKEVQMLVEQAEKAVAEFPGHEQLAKVMYPSAVPPPSPTLSPPHPASPWGVEVTLPSRPCTGGGCGG